MTEGNGVRAGGDEPARKRALFGVVALAQHRIENDNETSRRYSEEPANELAGRDLSRREVGVLTLVAGGFSNREIAILLCLTENTVKSHIQRIMAKLGAQNRSHSVALAFHRGVLRIAPSRRSSPGAPDPFPSLDAA